MIRKIILFFVVLILFVTSPLAGQETTISQLSEATSITSGDLTVLVDVSDTSQSTNGSTKKVTLSTLLGSESLFTSDLLRVADTSDWDKTESDDVGNATDLGDVTTSGAVNGSIWVYDNSTLEWTPTQPDYYTDSDIDGNESAFDNWDKNATDDLNATDSETISGLWTHTSPIYVNGTESGTDYIPLHFHWKSPSAADNDELHINYAIGNDIGTYREFVKTTVIAADVTNGTEDGTLTFQTMRDGTLEEAQKIASDEIVINESGKDRNFRIEGNTEPNAFFLDGTNGFIGIKTTSPDFEFETTDDSYASIGLSTYHDTANIDPRYVIRRAQGTEASPSAVVDDDSLGRFMFKGYDGTDFNVAAQIRARVNGTPSDGTDMPGELHFATSPDGSDSPANRLTIHSDGDFDFHNNIVYNATFNKVDVSNFTQHHEIFASGSQGGVTAPTYTTIGTFRAVTFDADDEIAFIDWIIPQNWIGTSDMTLKAYFTNEPGTVINDGETVIFNYEYYCVGTGEALDNGTAVNVNGTYTQSGSETDGELLTNSITLDYDNADQPLVKHNILGISINREFSTDTYGADINVVKWEIESTADTFHSY